MTINKNCFRFFVYSVGPNVLCLSVSELSGRPRGETSRPSGSDLGARRAWHWVEGHLQVRTPAGSPSMQMILIFILSWWYILSHRGEVSHQSWCSQDNKVVIFVPQGAAGDHLPPRQHFEEPWDPEGGQGGHLHAGVAPGSGSHVGVCSYWGSAHRGVCRLQLGGSGRKDPGWWVKPNPNKNLLLCQTEKMFQQRIVHIKYVTTNAVKRSGASCGEVEASRLVEVENTE